MAIMKIQVEKREAKGKGASRALRRSGMLPAVLYGEAKEPMPLKINERNIERIIAKESAHALLELEIGSDEKSLVMIKDIQHAIVTSKILHLDLIRISMDRPVEVKVPFHPVNVEELKKIAGVVVQQMVSELDIECLPGDIPESVTLDLSQASPGDSFTVADLKVQDGIKILNDPDEVVCSVIVMKAEEVAAPAAEAAAEGEGEGEGEGEEKAEGEDKKKEKD